MHDHDVEPTRTHTPKRAEPTTSAAAPANLGARPAHHDAASLLHLQRTAGNAGVVQLIAAEAEDAAGADAGPSPVLDVVGRGGGTPLDESTRTSMEGRFGESFADVRVHTDDRASRSAESVGANAYTVGSDIVFRAGHFDTASTTGQRTLAHELSHVVQQRTGPVDGSAAAGGIRLSDPSDRFEQAAEATAAAVLSSGPASPASAPAEATAQRQIEGEEEDETVQTSVQRDALEGGEEEEEEVPG